MVESLVASVDVSLAEVFNVEVEVVGGADDDFELASSCGAILCMSFSVEVVAVEGASGVEQVIHAGCVMLQPRPRGPPSASDIS